MMALNPGDREHDGDKREHAAGAIEKGDAAIGVVLAHDFHQVAVLASVVDEVVEMAEGIDHDVQPDETHQTNDEHLDELAQHVAIDDRGHGRQRAVESGADILVCQWMRYGEWQTRMSAPRRKRGRLTRLLNTGQYGRAVVI
jgi:hypothetical protein